MQSTGIQRVPTEKDYPLNIAGSSTFGEYPKISVEQTWNSIISDGWTVPYGGDVLALEIESSGIGRSILSSYRANRIFVIVNDNVYSITSNLSKQLVGTINTFNGFVSMAENEKNEIAICDGTNIWIYSYITGSFSPAFTSPGSTLDFLPDYVTYQNGFFIAGNSAQSSSANAWALCDLDNSLNWPNDTQHRGGFQTKADNVIAIVPFPGGSNLLFVMGNIVIEPWYNVGATLFPYQKQQYNIDYGTISPASVDFNEDMAIWLGQNEKSQLVLMYSNGGSVKEISTDGINYLFAHMLSPEDSYGFLYKQDGHLLYQFTFPTANKSFIYDFKTKKFFNVSDKNLNYHPAKKMVLFNHKNYFISNKDANLYEFGTQFTTYNGDEIPRIRVCENVRLANSDPFIVNQLTFTMQQGDGAVYSANSPRIDLSISNDGGVTFGSNDSLILNDIGNRKNKVNFYQLGYCNDFVAQFRFLGVNRFIATNGLVTLY